MWCSLECHAAGEDISGIEKIMQQFEVGVGNSDADQIGPPMHTEKAPNRQVANHTAMVATPKAKVHGRPLGVIPPPCAQEPEPLAGSGAQVIEQVKAQQKGLEELRCAQS